jgi:hypothetical protein
MAMIECHGCLRNVEEATVKWVRPFDSSETDDNGVIHVSSGVTDFPRDGAVPYCPTCLEGLQNESEE